MTAYQAHSLNQQGQILRHLDDHLTIIREISEDVKRLETAHGEPQRQRATGTAAADPNQNPVAPRGAFFDRVRAGPRAVGRFVGNQVRLSFLNRLE